jgi:hypothetical protein
LKMTPSRVAQIGNHIADFSLAYIHNANGSATGAARSRRGNSRRESKTKRRK